MIGIYIQWKNCAQVDLVNGLELAWGRAIEACHVRHKTQIQKRQLIHSKDAAMEVSYKLGQNDEN